ncbi:MAG: nickel pincer cofactor biosynthesis protein LarB [Calditerrivibrio sp.]|nr:nickel pincer cofactor biosynthesis protein LarB [Calditerrivibrio sp.]MCA1932874.1 nickel pincer cofactor biosynthesis protein LarB [Calditerrivibrio sp.]MCA1979964.1 nickel pincer cofactor biosynthesis protein LarB [Calditerrivibrio sp.]
MNKRDIQEILDSFSKGSIDRDRCLEMILHSKSSLADIDLCRRDRLGFDEVVFGKDKSVDQILEIIKIYKDRDLTFLCTKLDKKKIDQILAHDSDFEVFYNAGIIRFNKKELKISGKVAIVTAGTSDLYIANEASVVLDTLGTESKIFPDVGVAGVHRFFNIKSELEDFDVLIVIAGMEGALPSLVGGLFYQPVIAVPVSVGYGTALGGFTPLFAMLTSCSNGITVVNIDNGFGAAIAAYRILKVKNRA